MCVCSYMIIYVYIGGTWVKHPLQCLEQATASHVYIERERVQTFRFGEWGGVRGE